MNVRIASIVIAAVLMVGPSIAVAETNADSVPYPKGDTLDAGISRAHWIVHGVHELPAAACYAAAMAKVADAVMALQVAANALQLDATDEKRLAVLDAADHYALVIAAASRCTDTP